MLFSLSSSMNIHCKKDDYNYELYRKNLRDKASKQHKKLLKNLEIAEKHRKHYELQQYKKLVKTLKPSEEQEQDSHETEQ